MAAFVVCAPRDRTPSPAFVNQAKVTVKLAVEGWRDSALGERHLLCMWQVTLIQSLAP